MSPQPCFKVCRSDPHTPQWVIDISTSSAEKVFGFISVTWRSKKFPGSVASPHQHLSNFTDLQRTDKSVAFELKLRLSHTGDAKQDALETRMREEGERGSRDVEYMSAFYIGDGGV